MWKELKNIGLPSEAVLISKICLKEIHFIQFNDKQNANTSKNFYWEFASDLVDNIQQRENFSEKTL